MGLRHASIVGENARVDTSWHIRNAQPGDASTLVRLIGELAEFEKLSHLVQVTPQALSQHLFGPQPAAHALLAHAAATPDTPVVAFALYFTNFSTFLGRPGLYLEDLYVQPPWRGRGLGRALLRHLGALAVERGCGRFEWSVLDWNEEAIAFYEKMGATVLPDWRICRVTGDALQTLASSGGEVRP